MPGTEIISSTFSTPLHRLDLDRDQRAFVGDADRLVEVGAGIVVVGDAESRAAHAVRRIVRDARDCLCLRPSLHHRHQQTHGAAIERPGSKW